MECQCEQDSTEDAVTEWWQSSSSVQMGAFTVVGYLLYRFSQTLPALIRWPIRLFCSLTGLSTLWSWVSRLVGALRVIQALFKWLSRVWRFVIAFSSRFKWLVAVMKAISGSSRDGALESETSNSPNKPGLRVILLGPTGGGRTSLAHTLLGDSETRAPTGPLMESTKRRAFLDGRELTVIDTPDLLGPSLGGIKRAREALRSLQLASPGPHAFLLVMRAPGSSPGTDQDAAQAVRAAADLFGDAVVESIIPVLTHADRLGPGRTGEHLLGMGAGGLRGALSPCSQRAELVDNRPGCPPGEQGATRRQLVGRVAEATAARGLFVHELQRREERVREELLADMASALAGKLGHA